MDIDRIFSDKYGKDLMEIHRLIVELEQIEIVKQRSGMPSWKSEKKYQEFFSRVKEAVAIVQDGMIVRANEQIAKITDRSLEEITGVPFSEFVHPSEISRIKKHYDSRIAGSEAPIVYKTVVKHKDGSNVHIKVRAGVITYRNEPAIFVIVDKDPDEENK
ncbi:MAG: PAS domain S-box protein [Candidatus Aminicenantes bacterium]|jgi:PAS domain S-box-containing protein